MRIEILNLFDETLKLGASKDATAEALELDLRTIQRWKKGNSCDQRRGPKTFYNQLSEEERNKIVEIANCKKFRNLTPNKIVPALADEGFYLASERTFYRVLKAENLLKHRAKQRPARYKRPEPIVATAPNKLWSWDITYLYSPVRGSYYYLYLVMDVYSRFIVGAEVHDEQNSELASKLIERCCREQNIDKEYLTLHSDNGGPMKGATMLATLQKLGVVPSFNRPGVSSDNAFSESLFKTMKYVPNYPRKPFTDLAAASKWCTEFVNWYNYEHLHSEIKYVTPFSRHNGSDLLILKKRTTVYEEARKRNPLRWKNTIRSWDCIKEVGLNYQKKRETQAWAA